MKAAAACIAGLCLTASAVANVHGHWDTLTINVETQSGDFASWQVNIANGLLSIDGSRLDWSLASPIVLEGTSGQPLATIADCSYGLVFSPRAGVELDFAILAANEPITVTATSPVLEVPEFAAGTVAARTSVALTLTDGNDGAAEMVSANSPIGTGAYIGRINGLILADLIFQMAVTAQTPGGSLNANGSFPNFGFATIGIPVQNISSDLAFTLTPGDVMVVDGAVELDQAIPGFACVADFDSSGLVDLGDLTIILSAYGTCSGGSQFVPEADLDEDGCISLQDLAEFLNLFGAPC